jgi:phenylpropionate dioxygenase-like ring-hydroxylating dioxygenase large terminal subunit
MPVWDTYTWPRTDFSRVPYGVFSDADLFEREQERVFRGPVWHYLALEAELPRAGDYRVTYVGTTQVVVVRGDDSTVSGFVNRCAHRGTQLVRDLRGNVKDFTCVYHHWCYDRRGRLIGVPFIRGPKGKGGMPRDFKLAEHGLKAIRGDTYAGSIFGTFADAIEPLGAFLDAPMREYMDRLFAKPIVITGYSRQRIPGNWKLYFENLHDVYHAGLLHQMSTTFGLYRATEAGRVTLDKGRRHKVIFSIHGSDDRAESKREYEKIGWLEQTPHLNDMSVFSFTDEFGDRKASNFMALFPSSVYQQLSNSLATRQIRPKSPTSFELFWTYFGYADDPPALKEARMKQANIVGPAGFSSMEDGEVGRLVQLGIRGERYAHSVIEMGGVGPIESQDTTLTEVPVRGFWKNYCALMGIVPADV